MIAQRRYMAACALVMALSSSLTAGLLLVQPDQALAKNASETKSSIKSIKWDEVEKQEDKSYATESITELKISGQNFESSPNFKGTMNSRKNFDLACKEFNAAASANNICDDDDPARPEQYSQMFESASKALGIPEVILLCMTGVESGFKYTAKSTDGAESEGLAQVTRKTAPHLASLFDKDKHGFKSVAWENFKKGSSPPMSSIPTPTKDTIRSTNPKDAPVQIFAMAMYLRNSIIGDHQELKQKNINLSTMDGLKKITHYLVASYNGGMGTGRIFLDSGMNDSSIEGPYTQRYFKRIDKCLDRMAKGF